jgi:hypothetical protein
MVFPKDREFASTPSVPEALSGQPDLTKPGTAAFDDFQALKIQLATEIVAVSSVGKTKQWVPFVCLSAVIFELAELKIDATLLCEEH